MLIEVMISGQSIDGLPMLNKLVPYVDSVKIEEKRSSSWAKASIFQMKNVQRQA